MSSYCNNALLTTKPAPETAGKGKGPQAGVAVPYVSGYSTTPTYKSLTQKGKATTSLTSESAIGSPNEEVVTSMSYCNTVDLCNLYLDQLPTEAVAFLLSPPC